MACTRLLWNRSNTAARTEYKDPQTWPYNKGKTNCCYRFFQAGLRLGIKHIGCPPHFHVAADVEFKRIKSFLYNQLQNAKMLAITTAIPFECILKCE